MNGKKKVKEHWKVPIRESADKDQEELKNQMDWVTTLVPLFVISIIVFLLVLEPDQSKVMIDRAREILNNQCGLYYSVLGTGILICSIYIAFSGYGKIVLGGSGRPEYSPFQWGAMIFTSTMAADILFYSLCEWALYAEEPYIKEMGGGSKMGFHLSAVSLGAYRLGVLHYFSSCLWVYASYSKA